MFKKHLLYILIAATSFYIPSTCAQITSFPKREFRGVWVATVNNMDWPSKPGLPSTVQQQELKDLLNKHQLDGINAIIFQVRPTADAFHGKGREPWSHYLTGEQGLPPTPYYDPLAWITNEGHRRGMEVHAWLNPYRASFDTISPFHEKHIIKQMPQWFFTYGSKRYFNPGIPEVRKYIIQVVLDVVRNYDIDGIHFDDYFYPYPEEHEAVPDIAAYFLYGKGFNDIEDWRRHNVNLLIHELSDSIHACKPYLKFGISPFGVWRNKSSDPEGSETNAFEGFSQLYADARLWVKEGWIDYIVPQLYFTSSHPQAPFDKLIDWWSQNSYGKHLFIGQALYRAADYDLGWSNRSEIPNQIRYLRQNPNIQGSIFFRSKSLCDNLGGVSDSLRFDFYQYPALIPAMPWLKGFIPNAPKALKAKELPNKHVEIRWIAPKTLSNQHIYGYIIYRIEKGEDLDLDDPKNILKISFDGEMTSFEDVNVHPGLHYRYYVTAIDRLKNEGLPSNWTDIRVRP